MERVQFFDKKSVPITQPGVSEVLKKMTACCASPDGYIWIGTRDGRLVRLDVGFAQVGPPIQAFPENQPVLALRTSKQCLVALGRIGATDMTARLCAYHLYRSEESGAPVLVGSARVPGELGGTCMDVTSDFSFIAVGCAKGQTLIYSGGSGFGRPGTKPRILAPEATDHLVPVTSVRFLNKSTLFIVNEKEVACISVSESGVSVVHADSSVGLLVKDPSLVALGPVFMQNILVAKPDAIYGFSPGEGNTSATQYVEKDIEIHLIDSWKHYLAIFHQQAWISVVATYPSSSRIVAGSVQLPKGSELLGLIPGAFDGHSLIAVTSMGDGHPPIVLNLREKPVADQLEILTAKRLFETAIDLASFTHQPKEITTEIVRKYGDYFFDNQEYEKAVSVYGGRGGSLVESSYVINKFLLTPTGGNKTQYLVEYLKRPSVSSSPEHTLLLILCLESLGNAPEIQRIVSTMPESTLLDLIANNPSAMLRFVSSDDLDRIYDGKRLLECLLEVQEIDKFSQQVTSRATKVDAYMRESPFLKTAITNLAINDKLDFACTDAAHVDFCRTKNPSPIIIDSSKEVSDDMVVLGLELALRTKGGNTRDLVKELINRGKAVEALHLCKLFGAPANIVALLATTLNKPIEKLAYPAMAFDDETDELMSLNALAVLKRTGQTQSMGSRAQTSSAAYVIETAEIGSSFGTIKGTLMREWRSLEEEEYECKQRSENDDVEVTRMRSEVSVLKRKPIIHSINDTKTCAYCNCPLSAEIPVALFRCMHAFHEHCMERNQVCRICSAESQHHREILHQRRSAVRNHDELFRRMTGGHKFKAIMAYLGHGLFEPSHVGVAAS
jgi:hypothetical protein